jgi:hypothetical protein
VGGEQQQVVAVLPELVGQAAAHPRVGRSQAVRPDLVLHRLGDQEPRVLLPLQLPLVLAGGRDDVLGIPGVRPQGGDAEVLVRVRVRGALALDHGGDVVLLDEPDGHGLAHERSPFI